MTASIIQTLEQEQIDRDGRELPEFRAGDTLRIGMRIVEGSRERVQFFEGVCIARRNAGWRSSVLVRKISFNQAVERQFLLYHPRLEHLEVVRRGRLRRAKLYYLRDRQGKRARIVESRRRSHHRSVMVRPSASDSGEESSAS